MTVAINIILVTGEVTLQLILLQQGSRISDATVNISDVIVDKL